MIRLEYFSIAAVNRLARDCGAGSLSCMSRAAFTLPVALVLATVLSVPSADAQQVYRYKDKSGQWVYTDRPPDGQAAAQTLSVAGGASSPRIVVQPRSSSAGVALVAVHECRCTVEFGVKASGTGGMAQATGTASVSTICAMSTTGAWVRARRASMFKANTACG